MFNLILADRIGNNAPPEGSGYSRNNADLWQVINRVVGCRWAYSWPFLSTSPGPGRRAAGWRAFYVGLEVATEVFAHIHRGLDAATARRRAQSHGTLCLQGNDLEKKCVFPPCCKSASLHRAGFIQTIWGENSLVLHRYACENRRGESVAMALKALRPCFHAETGNDFIIFYSFICFDFSFFDSMDKYFPNWKCLRALLSFRFHVGRNCVNKSLLFGQWFYSFWNEKYLCCRQRQSV